MNSLYKTGSASDNSDYFQHAKFTSTTSGVQIGFEDLNGGGDKDFNDAIIKVINLDNSQDGGKSNSSNEALNNPNQTVVKGSDLKAQAHNKAINNSQFNKALVDNLQSLHTQLEQNNFKELNNTKKIQDNFSKEAVINPLAQSYYSDTNKIFTQAVLSQLNKIQPVVGNQKINVAEDKVKLQGNLNNNNQYLNISSNNKKNSILDKKSSTNHSGLVGGSNSGQGLVNSKNSNQGIDNPNKVGGSPEAKLLNDFLKKNI